jgi:hypothetical protein
MLPASEKVFIKLIEQSFRGFQELKKVRVDRGRNTRPGFQLLQDREWTGIETEGFQGALGRGSGVGMVGEHRFLEV